MLTLKILGCGDAFNSGGRRHTSFLLEQPPNYKILIDCGATTVLAFKQLDLSFDEVDCIVLSHFHGDHYGGLPYLLLEAAKVTKRTKPLLLVSPPGLEERIEKLMQLLYPGSEDALEAFPINYQSYKSTETLELPFGKLTAYEVVHADQTLPHGLRFEIGGVVVSYSGDTGWHENLIKLAENSDLFICECNYKNTETSSHLNYRTLLEKQDALNSKRIVLTHLGEEMLKTRNKIKFDVLEDGQEIEL